MADGSVVSDKTARPAVLAVEDITWETTTSTDLGLDVNFLNNRLQFHFDYYWKETKDMLLNIEIPYFMGYNNLVRMQVRCPLMVMILKWHGTTR